MNTDPRAAHFSEYLDGDLPPGPREALERGLEESPELRQRYDEFAAAIETVRELPRHPLPRSFAIDVLAQEENREATQRSSSVATWMRWAALILVGIAVTVLSFEWRLRETLRDRQALLARDLNQSFSRDIDELSQRLSTRLVAIEGLGLQEFDWPEFARMSRESREDLSRLAADLQTLSSRPADGVSSEQWAALDASLSRIAASQVETDQRIRRVLVAQESLAGIEKRLSDRQRAMQVELRSLADTTPREPDDPVALEPSSPPPAELASRNLSPEPVEIVVAADGSFRFRYDPTDPEAIDRLFQLYKLGVDPIRGIALDCLETQFRGKVAVASVEPTRGIKNFFATQTHTTEQTRQSQRVSAYHKYWLKQRRDNEGDPPR